MNKYEFYEENDGEVHDSSKESDLDGIESKKKDLIKSKKESMMEMVSSVSDLIPGVNLDSLIQKGTEVENGSVLNFDRSSKTDHEMVRSGGFFDADFSYKLLYGLVDRQEDSEDYAIKEEIEEVFKDQVVVNLGAGRLGIFGYAAADLSGAKGYVAVEPGYVSDLVSNMHILKNPELYNDEKLMDEDVDNSLHKDVPVSVVEEDMLTFLKRLPEDSVSVWMSGIDEIIIKDKEYRIGVMNEIKRVLHPDGGYVGQIGMSIGLGLSDFDRESVGDNKSSQYGSAHLYRKKKTQEDSG